MLCLFFFLAMASDPKKPIISNVETFLVGSSTLEKEIPNINFQVLVTLETMRWNHQNGKMTKWGENACARDQLQMQLVREQSRRVTLLRWRGDLLKLPFWIHFSDIPLLHWRSTFTAALHFYSSIVVDAALKWHTCPQWLILYCISTMAYHLYSDIPLWNLRSTFTFARHFYSWIPLLQWQSILQWHCGWCSFEVT